MTTGEQGGPDRAPPPSVVGTSRARDPRTKRRLSASTICPACGQAASSTDCYCGSCGATIAAAAQSTVAAASTTTATLEPAVDTGTADTPSTVAPASPTPLTGALSAPVAHASFTQRAAASLIDLGIVYGTILLASFGVGIVLYTAMPESEGDRIVDQFSDTISGIILIAAWVLYRPILWQLRDGQSFGQSLAKIRTRTIRNTPMTFLNGLGRQAAATLLAVVFWPILWAIDNLWMTWDKTGQRQTLHDKIANTIVVQAKTKDAR
jgi:uncharacterized RDD family membrane protein YckC